MSTLAATANNRGVPFAEAERFRLNPNHLAGTKLSSRLADFSRDFLVSSQHIAIELVKIAGIAVVFDLVKHLLFSDDCRCDKACIHHPQGLCPDPA